jgi:cytoskeleton protein RodZ
VVIKARGDVWIQVRGADGSAVVSRILRNGESYAVPPGKKLTLMTGNAGALEISVDGRAVPPIGTFGTVRRDVALDAEKLLAGTAVGQ